MLLGLSLQTGRVLRYATMPEVGVRVHGLFMGGLGYVPFFIATVYQMVGLLPRHHPYLMQHNIGLYGIRHVIAEAARNLKFSLKNIDQIILFFAVMAGLLLFFVQFIALGAMFFFQPAYAAMPTNWAGFFSIANAGFREQDLAFIMLDLVFGVPHPSIGGMGFFESCVGTNVRCQNNFGVDLPDINDPSSLLPAGVPVDFGPLSSNAHTFFPFPYHEGIHRLFAVYSNGLLVVAVFVTSYFIATILAETAQTGTPFGRRFNKVWAPLRIVMAFGLLMPLTVGLNSSQYIVLYAAKYGSAFASNGWRIFVDALGANNIISDTDLVMQPNRQPLNNLTHFMYVSRVCKQAYDHYRLIERRRETGNNTYTLTASERVQAYIMGTHDAGATDVHLVPSGEIYDDVLTYVTNFGNIGATDRVVVRFGVEDRAQFGGYQGYVAPVCGEVILTLTDKREFTGVGVPGSAEFGPYLIQANYWTMIESLWHENNGVYNYAGGGTAYPARTTGGNHRVDYRVVESTDGLSTAPGYGAGIDSVYVNNVNENLAVWHEGALTAAAIVQRTSGNFTSYPAPSGALANTSPLYEKGWAAAGIWYQSISDMNGSVVASAYAVPYVSKYPMIMEAVKNKKAAYNQSVTSGESMKPEVAGVDDISTLIGDKEGPEFAMTLWSAYKEWGEADGGTTRTRPSGNAFLDAVNLLFGTQGLYDLRANAGTHPLAMLSGVGRSLVESSLRNLGWAAAGATISGLKGFFGDFVGKLGNIAASFLVTVAMLGLTVGIILFYVVPFLPFLYFFFAVGGWIKGIFEALVGAPLWALAHIRIDGNGLPGQAALNGYFLIFEVFLRPILIVFGLLASISTYSALVNVLNVIFPLVSENAGGYDVDTEMTSAVNTLQYMRSRIDEFFFTVLYAIIVYMLGMASFKLIDLIPNNILRWMGQSVATFGDQREDPAQGLVSRASVGTQQGLSKIGGGLQGMVGLTK